MNKTFEIKALGLDVVIAFLGLFAFLIPIHRTAAHVALAIAIIFFLLEKRINEARPYFFMLAPTFLFVLYLLNVLLHYTPDTNWLPIEKKVLLFFFPLFVYFCKINKNQIRQLFFFYITGCLVFTVLSICKAVLFYNAPTEHFAVEHLPHQLAIDLHAPYLSLLLTLANFCIFYLISENKFKLRSYFYYLLLIVYFTVFILILSSRMALTLNFLVVFSFIYYWAKVLNKKKIFYATLVVFVSGVLLMFFSYAHMQERFMSVLRGSGEGVSERMMVTKAASLIISDHFFTGVGLQHVQDVLVEYYKDLGYPSHMYELNPHNEYIFNGVAMGVFGILYITVMLGLPMYLCLKIRRPLLLLPFIILAFSFLTEVYLERFWGVAVFVFFYTLFVRLLSDQSIISNNSAFHQTTINVAESNKSSLSA